ncbi:ABC transporter ATP-binding protein [Anopheles sinensis]|uniref:ABC transporter ATP-binding protein n=1 Tax=Anopheles sinensis TaxID=74873 RepID=A0A084VSR7_ANOSI|nr:ABC transporter ATP-binding protein [Anopheles sinensis]
MFHISNEAIAMVTDDAFSSSDDERVQLPQAGSSTRFGRRRGYSMDISVRVPNNSTPAGLLVCGRAFY